MQNAATSSRTEELEVHRIHSIYTETLNEQLFPPRRVWSMQPRQAQRVTEEGEYILKL